MNAELPATLVDVVLDWGRARKAALEEATEGSTFDPFDASEKLRGLNADAWSIVHDLYEHIERSLLGNGRHEIDPPTTEPLTFDECEAAEVDGTLRSFPLPSPRPGDHFYEGCAIFESDAANHPPLELQCCDDEPVFKTDGAAWEWVFLTRNKISANREILDTLRRDSPDEYDAIRKHMLAKLEGEQHG